MINFDNPLSNISITNSVFFGNLADVVGCLYAYQNQGILYLQNNTFINNTAFTRRKVGIGSASVLEISGLFAEVISISNLYFQNIVEYSGTIGIYYGILNESFSQFIGKNNFRKLEI